jgi:glycerol-3-phosphate O-acyltransferase/dihydroxyacetone phosphate acyltransferase
MALSFKNLVSSVLGSGAKDDKPPSASELFVKTDPKVDGDECLHDCENCSARYPRGFKIEEEDVLYGHVAAWSTHVLVGTGKTDWVRDVEEEEGSVMQAFSKAVEPSNGKLKLSASNMPTPHDTDDYSEPTTLLLLPAFKLLRGVHPLSVPRIIAEVINQAPTSTSPLTPTPLPASLPSPDPAAGIPDVTLADCPHNAVILMCSHRTRDVRCAQSAPVLRKEFERQLRPLGLYRDLHDERPGGVGIYYISHVGGHKYSANVMIYRRPNAFGLDDAAEKQNGTNGVEKNGSGEGNVGAAQGIWLARVMPEDCENLIRYTVLRGKVVKPERQLRGGFDRGRGVMSW